MIKPGQRRVPVQPRLDLLPPGQLPPALADLDKAIAADPKYGNGYFVRGMVHSANGETDLAIADLEKALTLDLNDQAKQVAQNELQKLKP